MLGKLSIGGAALVAACLSLAVPASADPSVFGVLSCTCGDASPGSPPCTDDMTEGMQQGLSIQPAVAVTTQ